MNNNQILLSYPDSKNKIRTVLENSVIHFSLTDVVSTLASQNTKISQGNKGDGLSGLIKAQVEVLEEDEYIRIQGEDYVTEPGLFRIILRDNSSACKKFQRWVLHEILPSIQKYGTYPPPLVEQNSDVKRIVQSLLLEIEEREKLEKRTKEQFEKHETMLNELSKRISTSSSNHGECTYISVEEYCNLNGVDPSHKQLIFGWCLKIVAEDNEPSAKQIKNGKETLTFPDHVIAKADRIRVSE